MKTLKVFILSIVIGSISFVKAQVLLNADFNLGLPAGWGMSPAGSWSVHPFFGPGMSKCLYTEEMNTASTTVSFFSTGFDLAGISTLTVSFKAACTKNNFLIPNIAVFYDAGAGKQFMARWGSGFTSPTTYTLDDVADYIPPLDTANIKWVNCTHTLSAPTGTNVSFYFDAEMINAGYVLLDDIMIAAATNTIATGFDKNINESKSTIFPNPVKEGELTLLGENISGIRMVNILGQDLALTYKSASGKALLDLRSFAPGVYFIRYSKNRNSFVKRIVIE